MQFYCYYKKSCSNYDNIISRKEKNPREAKGLM